MFALLSLLAAANQAVLGSPGSLTLDTSEVPVTPFGPLGTPIAIAGAVGLVLRVLLSLAKSPWFGFIWLKVPTSVRVAIIGILTAGATGAAAVGGGQDWITALTTALVGVGAGLNFTHDLKATPTNTKALDNNVPTPATSTAVKP